MRPYNKPSYKRLSLFNGARRRRRVKPIKPSRPPRRRAAAPSKIKYRTMDRPVGYEAFSHVVFFRLRNNQGFLTTAIDEETDHDAVLRPTLHMFCGTFRLFITNVNGFVKRVRLYVQDEADLTLLHMMHHDLILRVYAFREIKSGSPADPS